MYCCDRIHVHARARARTHNVEKSIPTTKGIIIFPPLNTSLNTEEIRIASHSDSKLECSYRVNWACAVRFMCMHLERVIVTIIKCAPIAKVEHVAPMASTSVKTEIEMSCVRHLYTGLYGKVLHFRLVISQ